MNTLLRLVAYSVCVCVCVLASLGCSNGGTSQEERLSTVQSRFVDGEICTDGASDPPVKIQWLYTFTGVQQATSFTLRLDAREPVTAVLKLVSEGLDFRTVERSYGSYSLTPGTPRDITVRLDELPLQGVSYSSRGSVKASITRADGSVVTLWAPEFYHHFSENYATTWVYSFDTMTEELDGGQHTSDAFDLRGRVWDHGAFIDIGELREEEFQELYSYPAPPASGPRITWGPIGPIQTGGSGFPVSVDWKTNFEDASHGEDIANTPGIQYLDASFAYAQIAKVVSTPCDAAGPTDPCVQIVWQGYLDKNGKVNLPNPVQNQQYFIWVYSQLLKATGINVDVHFHNYNGFNHGVQRWRFSVYVPPPSTPLPNFANLSTNFHVTAHGAAVMSRLISLTDLVKNNTSYLVKVNVDCPGLPNNACAQNGTLWTGPWTHATLGTAGGLRKKYVIAHEAGHLVQEYGSGIARWNVDGTPYDNEAFPFTNQCTCSHVTTSNAHHCLQSRETTAVAQTEGFGHFVATKLFNSSTGTDCKFNYYKEFRVQGGNIVGPPFNADCRNAVKWRDSFCDDSNVLHGTEWDWLQFLWNVNTVGSNKSAVGELFDIWKRACGTYPNACADAYQLLWNHTNQTTPDLLAGVEAQYGATNPKYQKFVDDGFAFGVDDQEP